ncbi:MAG: 2-amino-4-hydroxy-6-hydroxymethyldihydropteridine diphosphokinase [Anaerolineae bacterium]|nr:2-amino-4-hydroxy-6-hydroxymethyldihydropteridine diphosphokinase [Anaerolineae bacterium]
MTSNPVFITLGSNIAPEENLPRAVRLLAQRVTIKAVSRVYETPPIDASGQVNPDQGAFLNAAVLVETNLPPGALKLDVLRAIESRLGRVRSADKFAPRPIDLDIALYGDRVINDPAARITIPDPDSLTRAHVALPLADLAPGFAHPVTGQPLAAIAAPFAGQAGIIVRADVVING